MNVFAYICIKLCTTGHHFDFGSHTDWSEACKTRSAASIQVFVSKNPYGGFLEVTKLAEAAKDCDDELWSKLVMHASYHPIRLGIKFRFASVHYLDYVQRFPQRIHSYLLKRLPGTPAGTGAALVAGQLFEIVGAHDDVLSKRVTEFKIMAGIVEAKIRANP